MHCGPTVSLSTRSRWACPPISKRPCSKAQRWSASAPRSSASALTPTDLSHTMKIAFIGGGNMAAALIGGLIKRGTAPADIYAIDINDEARARTAKQFGIATGAAVDEALAGYDAIVLAVKPQVLKSVAEALAPHLSKQTIISIAAGIRATDLSRWLNGYAQIVRTMPNTPALIGMGVTG